MATDNGWMAFPIELHCITVYSVLNQYWADFKLFLSLVNILTQRDGENGTQVKKFQYFLYSGCMVSRLYSSVLQCCIRGSLKMMRLTTCVVMLHVSQPGSCNVM